jgi:hypothetical protein
VVLRLFSVMLRLLLLIFFTFCYFLLPFLLLVTFINYFLLVKGVRFVTFCYFFTACNFDKLFFTIEKGQGLYSIHCATGERVPCEKYSNAHVKNNV